MSLKTAIFQDWMNRIVTNKNVKICKNGHYEDSILLKTLFGHHVKLQIVEFKYILLTYLLKW